MMNLKIIIIDTLRKTTLTTLREKLVESLTNIFAGNFEMAWKSVTG